MTKLPGARSAMTARGRRQRSIWRYSWLFLAAIVLGLWPFFLHSTPEPPRGGENDTPPAPPNTISTHLLETRSGKIDLIRLVAEKDWETACVVEEYADPLVILARDFNMRASATTQPMINEEWKFHLWKIVVTKGAFASVYYLDNRKFGRLSKTSCLPLDRATLTYAPNGDRIFVELGDKS